MQPTAAPGSPSIPPRQTQANNQRQEGPVIDIEIPSTGPTATSEAAEDSASIGQDAIERTPTQTEKCINIIGTLLIIGGFATLITLLATGVIVMPEEKPTTSPEPPKPYVRASDFELNSWDGIQRAHEAVISTFPSSGCEGLPRTNHIVDYSQTTLNFMNHINEETERLKEKYSSSRSATTAKNAQWKSEGVLAHLMHGSYQQLSIKCLVESTIKIPTNSCSIMGREYKTPPVYMSNSDCEQATKAKYKGKHFYEDVPESITCTTLNQVNPWNKVIRTTKTNLPSSALSEKFRECTNMNVTTFIDKLYEAGLSTGRQISYGTALGVFGATISLIDSARRASSV